MKSLTVYSVAISCLLILFASSCGKREGVVPSDRKIDRVLLSEARYQDADTIFTSDELLSEQWVWDGRTVIRLDYYGDNQYSENFFYDGRRIVRTTVPAYDLRSEFEYDGRMLKQIDVYKKEELAATLYFKRDDKVVSEIVLQKFEADSEAVWPLWAPMPLNYILGNDVAQTIFRDELRAGRSNEKSGREVLYSLTWNDDNVVRIDVSGGVAEPYSITMTYDNKHNPYYQLYANHELNESIFGFKMLSQNNVTSVRKPYENKGMVYFKYAYTYDEDYPSSRKLSYSYRTMSGTFDSVTMRVERTEKYVYK